MIVSADLLSRAGVRNPDHWTAPLTAACLTQGITTATRLAPFLACVLHETGGLARMVESLDYAPAGLMATWPSHFAAADAARMGRTSAHPADQRAIAERAYGGRMGNRAEGSGDGYLYRGRGLIQITGRASYQTEAVAAGATMAGVVALMETPDGAASSAARYWARAGCNALCDAGNVRGARVRVNGGVIGMDDFLARCALLTAMLGGAPVHDDGTAALNDASLAAARAP